MMPPESAIYREKLRTTVLGRDTTAIQAEIARIESEAEKAGVSTASAHHHALLRPLYEKLVPEPIRPVFASGPEDG